MEEAKSIRWFENGGKPNEKYDMVFSLYEACDGWGKQYFDVWEPRVCELEDIAMKKPATVLLMMLLTLFPPQSAILFGKSSAN